MARQRAGEGRRPLGALHVQTPGESPDEPPRRRMDRPPPDRPPDHRILDVVVAVGNLNTGEIISAGAVRLEAMDAGKLQPGDEIMVLPKYESKNIEVTRGISTILYQLAVAAKVVLTI